MVGTHGTLDTVVVAVALAVTISAITAYGFLRPAQVPPASTPDTGPPAAPPNDGSGNPVTWPPLENGSSSIGSPVNVTYALRLSAATDRDVYAPGEVVSINVTLTSMENTTANLTLWGCWLTFTVEDTSGAAVYNLLGHVSCTFGSSTVSLPPGASYSVLFTWNQVADNGTAVPTAAMYTVVPRMSAPADGTLRVITAAVLITRPA